MAVSVPQKEAVVPIELDLPQPEEAAGQAADTAVPSTSTTNSQVPLTDPGSVASSQPTKSKEKIKGRAAKRAHHNEEVLNTNMAAQYVNMEYEEEYTPVSNGIPSYLVKAAPTTLGIEETSHDIRY